MRILLAGMMALLLLRAPETMAAAEAACALFVRSVMPGLFPYLTLSQMLVSRCGRDMQPGMLMLLSVLAGGCCAGRLAKRWTRVTSAEKVPEAAMPPVSFARAVEDSARTMLLVCGTMTMLRVFATLTDFLPDAMRLPLTTLLEVTTGAVTIANLPAPLPLRIALLSAATGFGGCAVIMQNRALYPQGLMRLGEQLAWQALHGVISGILALGIALLVLSAGGNL